MSTKSEGIFPKQNIPDSQKNEQWCKDNVLAMLAYQNYTTKFNRERKKDYENYLLFNGVFDTKQFEYITNTYGISSPARLVNHPIIAPKIDLLVGEFMSQPMDFMVEAVNEAAINKKLDQKVAFVAEKILRPIRQELREELGVEFEDEDMGMEIPDDIDKFLRLNGRMQVEQLVFLGLRHLIEKYRLQHIFKQGLYDLCITSKEFYHCTIKNGDPHARRVDPRALIWDINTDTENLQDASWVAEERFLTLNEILDEFGDHLSQDQVRQLEKMRYEGQDTLQRYNKPYQWYYKDDHLTPMRIRTVTACWKSIKTLKVKISPNKHDPYNPFKKVMPDDWKPRKGEKWDKKSFTHIWTTTMIGHDIIVDNRPLPNQIRREVNYSEAPLPYVGIIKNNIDSITLSIVDSLKNIQLLYNIVMYHIELALARSGGKAVIYDTSQKPNGLSLDDVFYHAKNSGVIPINTKQEGNQVGGFNQFQQIDFTLSNSVQQLINLKMMLENMAEQLTGISRAREGFTKSDAVGVNERSVMQSSLITQPLIANHVRTMDMVMNQLGDLMKIAWQDGKKTVHFIGETGMEMMKMISDFKNHDYSVFVKNSSKDAKDKEKIEAIGQQVLSGAGAEGFLQLMKVMNAYNAKDAEVILEQGLEAIQQQQAAQQQQMAEAQQQQAQATQQAAQMENQAKQMDNETKIQVAQIQAEALLESTRMKISGGQETQDYRQAHDMNMAMLNAENQMGMKQAEQDGEMLREVQEKEMAESKKAQKENKQSK
jgi:hypothetical protein